MRRRALVTTSTVLLLVGGVTAAQAWVTSAGEGDGRAHVIGRSDVRDINVVGDAVAALVPGVPTTLLGSFDNPNTFSVEVTTVHPEITRIVGNPGPCTADDFEITDAVAPPGPHGWVVRGGHTRSWKGGSITLINDAVHQVDGCLGAMVNLKYTANP